jgi:hypothetical protein
MVARVRPSPKALLVTFSRDGEEPEQMISKDGERAWMDAIYIISQRKELVHGERLTVCRVDPEAA